MKVMAVRSSDFRKCENQTPDFFFRITPNLVIEVTKRKKSSMVRPCSLAWGSLRPMNIFMFTDDSSLKVSFLEHREMLFA